MNYYFNEEANCLVINLKEVEADDRHLYESVMDSYRCLIEIESYEDNLYHLYANEEYKGKLDKIANHLDEVDEFLASFDDEYFDDEYFDDEYFDEDLED